jgi:hypothetical protein
MDEQQEECRPSGQPMDGAGMVLTATSKGILRKVVISKVENGFMVIVGCKTFVAYTWDEVSTGVDMYFRNPISAEAFYCK